MKDFNEKYTKIWEYMKNFTGEEEAFTALEELNMQYLQLLLKGIHQERTEDVLEATKQQAYIKSIVGKKLEKESAYHRIIFQAGINAGQCRIGDAWIREQNNENGFERSMTILCSKAHVRDIISIVYSNPGIQHKELAEMAGVKANYLTELVSSLVEAGCLRRYGTGKCTYYELTLQGKEFAGNNLPERRRISERRRFRGMQYDEEQESNGKRKEFIAGRPELFCEPKQKRRTDAVVLSFAQMRAKYDGHNEEVDYFSYHKEDDLMYK